jgi:hypothetical protein
MAVPLGFACAASPQDAGVSASDPAWRFRPHLTSESSSPPRATRKAAYAGLGLRQNPEGVVVAAVQPGPFGGDGFKSPSIWRGDLIVSINDQTLDVPGYVQLLRSLAAGDMLRVVYRRAPNPDPYSGVPLGDPNGEARTVEVVLDDAARWKGTLGESRALGRTIPPAQTGVFQDLILAATSELELQGAPVEVQELLAYLATLQRALLEPNSLPAVVHALERPLSLDRVESDFAAQLGPLREPRSLEETLHAIHQLVMHTLDVPALASQLDAAQALSVARREHQALAVSLLKAMRDGLQTRGAEFPRHLELIRASPQLTPLAVAMLPRVGEHATELERFAEQVSASPRSIEPQLAERVRAAVQGPVLGARLVDGALWVVGGDRANRYDMDLIAAVLDVGGGDSYTFTSPVPGSYQIVVDRSGDDVYQSGADFAGPATGVFSVAVVHDRAGDDRYVSHHQGAIAAGVFGLGVLVDEAGNDTYVNDSPGAGWSQAMGVYGAGVLIDRAGDDDYAAQVLAQGVGGPGGVGLIVDSEGDDIYAANGPHFPSAYATPGIAAGFSQGFGTGIRGYAAGGIGALYDFGGDDRYSVGEFGQGTGYFQGLGILRDAAGGDRYVGSRYAQGSAAHQAAGLLVDDGGQDSYTCSGAAAQGTAWDQSVAMLIDRGGDDAYFAAGLAQGSAAQQAVGTLIDLDGQDAYSCDNPCLGQSGDNTYHYDRDRMLSFSALIDRGGKADTYPASRATHRRVRTGALNQELPAASQCCGLFLDD